ncbi:NAD(P)/FAD-dependent oxidoreductase [Oceaniserpentilla sp. 4NH20-0058]|uniref:flavin-containing monooxygenase n=1 Tax=Oceaniserpentilla sp. 4NH20-0058 TaxID=3127660 RepID=UPI003103BFA5
MSSEHFDALIIGAGLSGISMACHLKQQCPNKSFAILERRQAIGGTWDLFRYPGIRSDSDMASFGFDFRPWDGLSVLANGGDIREYINETAREFEVDGKVHFGLKTTQANWDSQQNIWQVTTINEATQETIQYTCDFLIPCTGYYNYDQGFLPEFKGYNDFKGDIIHPQKWPENLDYAEKNVVIIGSGATAVTLVPAMADKTKHITMLQRSPSYVFTVPSIDKFSGLLKKFLPNKVVFSFARKRNIFLQRTFFKAAKRWPEFIRKLAIRGVKRQTKGKVDLNHFSPNYKPWDQRMCAVPDGDLFKAILNGQASVVTDHIDHFTETGIQLKSGKHLDADIIVTATGLNIQLLGGMSLYKDGQKVELNNLMTYKAVLAENMPNIAWIFGYTNSSWTLKADISAAYVCRLFNYMDENNFCVVVPENKSEQSLDETIMDDMQSGYIQRAKDVLPKQGANHPWRVLNKYEVDKQTLTHDPIEDGIVKFYTKNQTAQQTDLTKAS